MLIVRNFLFHRVSPERDELWDPMSVELFEKCIAYISRNYHVVKIEDLDSIETIKTKKGIATISFDDGYKDNIIHALPILSKYNVKASFYVVTDCINYNTPTWTHKLEYLFLNTQNAELNLDFNFLTEELKVKVLPTRQHRLDYVRKLKPELKKISHENRNLVLNKVSSAFNDVELPNLMMNWDDLKVLKNNGHTIGSHTLTHCMLGTMSNLDDVKYELNESAKIINQKLGEFPKTISYPVGSYNEATIKLSMDAGYKIGLAVKQDVYRPSIDEPFEIPRIELYNEPWWKTKLRITHSLERLKKLLKYR